MIACRKWCGGIVVLVSIGLSGCTTVHPRMASGTGTYFWLSQRLDWLYPYSLEEVRQAAFSALEVLQYDIETQRFDGLGGELQARPLVGQLAQIHADPLSPRTTKVQVRVPGSGGRQEAERIHATIRSELGM
jgi:hypothetical protein